MTFTPFVTGNALPPPLGMTQIDSGALPGSALLRDPLDWREVSLIHGLSPRERRGGKAARPYPAAIRILQELCVNYTVLSSPARACASIAGARNGWRMREALFA
ncbi:MAG TPA: hypothetical protein VKB93_23095 [Thermoanaerobaculia bacterium]|nr:hypothetical protein [Thermoanaerobaculia bacterium]